MQIREHNRDYSASWFSPQLLPNRYIFQSTRYTESVKEKKIWTKHFIIQKTCLKVSFLHCQLQLVRFSWPVSLMRWAQHQVQGLHGRFSSFLRNSADAGAWWFNYQWENDIRSKQINLSNRLMLIRWPNHEQQSGFTNPEKYYGAVIESILVMAWSIIYAAFIVCLFFAINVSSSPVWVFHLCGCCSELYMLCSFSLLFWLPLNVNRQPDIPTFLNVRVVMSYFLFPEARLAVRWLIKLNTPTLRTAWLKHVFVSS